MKFMIDDEVLNNSVKTHAGVNMDEIRRQENERKYGKDKLCDKCEGTGNQFFFMYQRCAECNGTGLLKIANE